MKHPHPLLLELNARVLLERLRARGDPQQTLATIDDSTWRELAGGFDYVWLMGVWRRSQRAQQCALSHPGLHGDYDRALPDWGPADVQGSPYAIYSYELDSRLGVLGDLATLRQRLHEFGVALIVDFVPNHLAVDHPWTVDHPRWFVRGTPEAAAKDPERFFSPRPGLFLAHGRDPYFPPWGDTVQVDFWSAKMRTALVEQLLQIAEQSDGVRCDMAMLALDRVFAKTWGYLWPDRSARPTEFWVEVIQRVKARYPNFSFIGEAYWGLGSQLLELGFDYVYDKDLYDLLRGAGAPEVRAHLENSAEGHAQHVHFLENHDEPRARAALGLDRSRAAAVIVATIPGLAFFHDGQLEGRQVRLPVQLIREPDEETDVTLVRFYERLLGVVRAPPVRGGQWRWLAVAEAWPGNSSRQSLMSWVWELEGQRLVVVVNFAADPAQGRVHLGGDATEPSVLVLRDRLDGAVYRRDRAECVRDGLYVALPPWGAHLFWMD